MSSQDEQDRADPSDRFKNLAAGVEPSFYQLPQHASLDRFRAREATLKYYRELYPIVRDLEDDGLPELPGRVEKVPKEQEFPLGRKAVLGSSKLLMRFNKWSAFLLPGVKTEKLYRRYYSMMRGPEKSIASWRSDQEFARQRVAGVNPMAIRCSREPFDSDLEEATREAIKEKIKKGTTKGRLPSLADLRSGGRLFFTDFQELLDPQVQKLAKERHPYALVTGPTSTFAVDDLGRLQPLAIKVRTGDGNSAIAAAHKYPSRWLVARTHAQAADALIHEGYYHLLETHLVNEAIAVCMFRRLYPEHPIRQLLSPHYDGNLAINHVARNNLLSPNGPIDVAMGAGVKGTFAGTRAKYCGWDIKKRTLKADLKERGVDNPGTLPDYPYRDDAIPIRDAIYRFVGAVLAPWYHSNQDVLEDKELKAWLKECEAEDGGAVPGFPVVGAHANEETPGEVVARIGTIENLQSLLTELIFRAGPQHAAVNNGQYDSYGFIPNCPGTFRAPLPAEGDVSEAMFWAGLPGRKQSSAQLGMVWVLSSPTSRSITGAGDSPAFRPEVSHAANEAVAAFRRRLHNISAQIQHRNLGRDVPYIYLDPRNISRSTDI